MECPICLNIWSSDKCIPLMLNCGHSFCQSCLMKMIPKEAILDQSDYINSELECPNCMSVITVFKNPKGQSIVD